MNSHLNDALIDHNSEQLLIDTFKELFDFSRDVLWLMAPDGSITYISPAIFLLRGISPEVAKRQKIEEILPPESAARSVGYFTYMLDEISHGRKPDPFQGSLDYFHADGNIINTEVYAVPCFDGHGHFTFLAGVSRDVSARVLEQEKARAEIKSREIEFRKMLNNVLEHEVRNAIAVINLSIKDQSIDPAIEKVINRSTENLLKVAEQVGLFSRSASFQNLSTPQEFSLVDLIEDLQKSLSFENAVRLSGETDVLLWAEYSLVFQLLKQLMDNARKYTSSGSDIFIHLSKGNEFGKSVLKIEISNFHMTPREINMSRLYDPFYRSPHVLGISGSGLGLSIAKHLAEMLGGSISIDYKESIFTVTAVLPHSLRQGAE